MNAVTPRDVRARKGGTPLVAVTAYTTPLARRADPHADVLLVGDSVGMVLYGQATTLDVSLETMVAHGGAVVRGSKRGCVVVDLPFGAYQESPQQAFRSAARVLAETGCQAVKLEGGREMVETVRFLTQRGIPVLGHVGLRPQAVHAQGGHRTQGRDANEAAAIAADARAVADAGAFALVVEGVVRSLADDITHAVAVPTIGIGASPACDGQILVSDDVVGLSTAPPPFAQVFGDAGREIEDALAGYADAVRTGAFPAARHVTDPDEEA